MPLIGHLTKGGLSASDERSHSYIGLRWPLHGAAAGSRGRPPHVYLPYACVPEVRKSAAQIAALLADEFVEIGSSGRIYDKDQIIGQLQQEAGEESLRTVSDFTARELADGLILVTYRIIEPRAVRSSIWKRTNSEWRMVFHQGTKFM